MPWAAAASTALRVSTSQTASWKTAATSATGTGSPARSRASTQRATAVLSPENEKSKRCRSRSRRAVSPRGKSIATRSPVARRPVDVRAAGERQPEQPGDLVERLPGRVVDGRAQRLDAARSRRRPAAGEECPPRDQQRQAGLGQRPVLELVDGDVGGEVVDAVQRLAEPERQRLGRGDADQQRAGQAGAAGDRDRVDVVRAGCRRSRRPARWSAPSPRGGRGWRPRARRRRSGRAPRRCWRPRRPAGCARGRCRRRSRRRRSRCRGPGARQSWRRHRSSSARSERRRRVGAVAVVARAPVDLGEAAARRRSAQAAGVVLAHLEQQPVGAAAGAASSTTASRSAAATPVRRWAGVDGDPLQLGDVGDDAGRRRSPTTRSPSASATR